MPLFSLDNRVNLSELAKVFATEAVATGAQESINNIPLDPQRFYEDFGFLRHPRTHEPVKRLAPYQLDIWAGASRYKYRQVVKTQKGGITTTGLLEDFHDALTWAAGTEILIIAQKTERARDHLYELRKLIIGSNKYRDYLIRKPAAHLLKDEVTKVNTIFVENKKEPSNPTKIIATGPTEASIWGRMHVSKIHMSDVAAIPRKNDAGVFNAAFTRLANTEGRMLIESPPAGQRGTFYKIYKMSKLKEDQPEEMMALGQFKVYEVPAREAVAAGIMTQEFLDAERARLGPLYGQYYECEFLNASNAWYPTELLDNQGSYEIDL